MFGAATLSFGSFSRHFAMFSAKESLRKVYRIHRINSDNVSSLTLVTLHVANSVCFTRHNGKLLWCI